MRVLYDGSIYHSQSHGGISRYYTNIIETMASLRPDWQFAIHVNPNPSAALPKGPNVSTTTRAHLRPRRLLFPVNYASREWLAWRSRPDVFHSTLGRPLWFTRCPVVAMIPDAIELVLPQYYPRLDRSVAWKAWNAAHADAIITISEQSKQDIVTHLKARPESITVIHLAASKAFRPASMDEVSAFKDRMGLLRPYALYVGHRGEHKNFAVARKAFDDARLSGFDLVLAGGQTLSDPGQGRLRQIASPDDETLRLLYAGAHAFVFPSSYEGFGIPLVEAMQCGVPVVASDIPTTREVCGRACLTFPQAEAGALVEAVLTAGIPARRKALVEAGFERARRYSWDKCAKETLDVYRAVQRG